MKSLICRCLPGIVLSIMALAPMRLSSQASPVQAETNPAEIAAYTEYYESLYGMYSNQVKNRVKTEGVQAIISGAFLKIRDWESEYASYLSSVEGFASEMKEGFSIGFDLVNTFLGLYEVGKAIKDNPTGLAAQVSFNDQLIDVASEGVTIYYIFKEVAAKGGDDNMLTGAERTKLFWIIEDHLSALNKRIQRLALNVRLYNWKEILFDMLQGCGLQKNIITNHSLEKWKHAAKAANQYYGLKRAPRAK